MSRLFKHDCYIISLQVVIIMEQIYYTFFHSPLGKIGVASSSQGVVQVGLRVKETEFLKTLGHRFKGKLVPGEKENQKVVRELRTYFAGNLKTFTTKLALQGTPFQLEVWKELKNIPYGQVKSYQDIASSLSRPKASRAVGNANKVNPLAIIVPCHRVIKSDGSLGGYSRGIELKRWLLELEGAV